ncbi:MAG: non-ribosomal peptide synthetase, partial [Flavobacteriaceae bacterium]|nr:non-ribosomal peptide synthetase [Flavobacteriaceae bacterium]
GEVENALSLLSGVIQSCVLAKKDKEGNNRLVGYVVMEMDFNKESLQSQLQESLPEYMVPQLWVEMDEIPLTPNGKLDRKALPELDKSEFSSKVYTAPRNDMEQQLATIWQELLSVERVGIYDNFFELGGHSLLATRLVSMVRKELYVEMTVRDVFTHTTIESLSAYLSKQEKGILLPSITKVHERPEKIPLSFSQERLWFLDRLQGSVEYHIPFAFRLSGNLNKKALSSSFKEIVNRHEVLRTVIQSEGGVGYQKILSVENWELSMKDITTNINEDVKAFLTTPFDLSSDYMFRSQLYDLGNKEYILAGVFHHIASDGWSQGILINEFIELYHSYTSNKQAKLPRLPLQYTDYALWQREHIERIIIEDHLLYWEKKLSGTTTLQLPTDYTRPAVQSAKGATHSFELDSALSKKINVLSQQQGVTVFMVLLTAFKVLLSRYSGQNDICVGTPIANRTQKELEDVIGFFVNTLSLRTQINQNDSFQDLLQQVKQTTLEAYDHQQVPFEKVVEHVVKTRDMSVTPLFQVMFVLQNTPKDTAVEMEGLTLTPYQGQEQNTSKFDITISVEEREEGFSMSINYCTDLFKEETIERMFVHYKELLTSIIASPNAQVGELSM